MATTYTILRLVPGQTIPRPVGRASSLGELAETIRYNSVFFERAMAGEKSHLRKMNAAKQAATQAYENPTDWVEVVNIDSEKPVHRNALGHTYYAFTE